MEISNIYIKASINIRNAKLKVKSQYVDLITMNREINADYSPALLSYLYNFKLEPKKDILATVLNLYNKGIMEIKHGNNGYIFVPNENIDLGKLTEDEKYIYYTLVSNEKREFSSDIWKKIVIDTYNKKFGTKKIYKKITDYQIMKINLIITLAITILLFIVFPLDDPAFNWFIKFGFFVLGNIFIFLPIMIITGVFFEYMLPNFRAVRKKLNQNEYEELSKWIKFERFMKDYTLINERKLDEIIIYEKYIPYAMVLNINKEYENEDVKYFVKNYMKNIKRNIGSHIDKELNKKMDQTYILK